MILMIHFFFPFRFFCFLVFFSPSPLLLLPFSCPFVKKKIGWFLSERLEQPRLISFFSWSQQRNWRKVLDIWRKKGSESCGEKGKTG